MLTTTPKTISPFILNSCQSITKETPRYIEILPTLGAEINNCFFNVKEQCENKGGQAILGWSVWEFPTVMIEFEFHAIWESPTGEQIDITPKPMEENKILFLPDNSKKFDYSKPWIRTDNIRKAIFNHPLIDEFISLAEKKFNLEEHYSQEYLIKVPEDKYLPIIERMKYLISIFHSKYHLKDVGRNDYCPCGSVRKFKKCCLAIIKY